MKIYILEDETLILKHLLGILKELPYAQVVGYAAEVAKAKKEIPQWQPDLILADIRLKDGDSFKLFSEIDTANFQVVFLTAYDEYAIQALNVGALAYLLKPVNEAVLIETLDKCYRKKEEEKFNRKQLEVAANYYHDRDAQRGKKLALKSLEFIEVIATDEIIFCKSDGGYTTFHLHNAKPIIVVKGLKDYEKILEPLGFLRCHQSYLVNVNFIKKYYKEGYLEMTNSEEVPVSTRKKEEVLKYLESIS